MDFHVTAVNKWYHFNKCSNVRKDKTPNNEWLSVVIPIIVVVTIIN
jgi:hypothetical protein